MNRKQQIDRLNSMKDADIDYSDAPELPDAVWNKAERAKFFKPIKVQKTVRIDADVLNWLESEGPGYQTRLNSILRREMEKALRS
ncbi:cytoplasmic protein [Candidatus Symbiopectobacterium sp. 'North America']|uniref:BrnA antitoxin family protein n=1 Tax=Candidatus Symbiopectobacterium sp. 'North America' TaxID=2794574 RepID=UPI0018CA24C0|nr:BrnA antitoxin family protein [Candidatus Symbiopectobacterium sp. 'North America']MBG6244730.1 cytoplasmic protein [Candidatus Symbiopectobacterium sp. 'North America']